MIFSGRTAALAFTIASMCLSGPAFACGMPTREGIAVWQARKDRALKVRGVYREVSRSIEVQKSDNPARSDLEITTVKGVVLRRDGKVRATVYHVFTNKIILCKSGRNPEHGLMGTVFAERRDDKRIYVIDFVEKRDR